MTETQIAGPFEMPTTDVETVADWVKCLIISASSWMLRLSVSIGFGTAMNYAKSNQKAVLLLSFTLACVVGSTAGCSSIDSRADAGTEKSHPTLETTAWTLHELRRGGSMVTVLPDTTVTLHFGDERLDGRGGCNAYFGAFDVQGRRLRISDVGSTMMACAPPIMEQEQDYLVNLTKAASYTVETGRLTMVDTAGRNLLVFLPEIPRGLTDGPWKLISYNSGNALVSDRTTEKITARFETSGNLSGFAGCNRFFSAYNIDDGRIEIGPVGATRRMCHEPDGVMQTEQGFLDVLGRSVRYEVRGDRLTLFDSSDRRMLIFGFAE